jgi:threonine synthase
MCRRIITNIFESDSAITWISVKNISTLMRMKTVSFYFWTNYCKRTSRRISVIRPKKRFGYITADWAGKMIRRPGLSKIVLLRPGGVAALIPDTEHQIPLFQIL